jgi:Flp pilus assembly protein TadD
MLLTLAVPGLWVAARLNFHFTALLLLIALSYAASIVLFFINARFRFPLCPFAVFFASGALELLRPDVRGAWSLRLCAGVGALTFLVLVLSLGNWGRVPPPTFERDYYFRSVAALRQGMAEAALTDVDRALAIDPEYLDARFHRANILYAAERFEEAAEAYRLYTLLDPAEQRGWGNMGMALLRSGKAEEATPAFHQAIRLAPENSGPWVNLLLSEIKQARYVAADELLRLMPPRVRELDVVRAAKALLDTCQNHDATAAREEWKRLEKHSPNVTGYILHFLGLKSFPPAPNP